MGNHAEIVAQLTDYLVTRHIDHPLRVGVDGRCGSGKSTLTRALVASVSERGRTAILVDSDGFHNVRAIRYRQGRASARGYYEDAYDLASVAEKVLRPLGPDGSRVYATAVHDMTSDEVLGQCALAPKEAIVFFDCTFLQRGSLRGLWDEVIYLQTHRTTAMNRGVGRDAQAMGGADAARTAYEDRYMAACDIYVSEENPAARASILIDYDEIAAATVTRWPGQPVAPAPGIASGIEQR